MGMQNITPGPELSLYVKTIMVFEASIHDQTVLPFYADGYPGIMYQETKDGLYVSPQNKKMPPFFLYGQTIHPIELSLSGPYRLIVFQLYPYAVRHLLDINPKEINDDCYDLTQLTNQQPDPIIPKLAQTRDLTAQVALVSEFISGIAGSRKKSLDDKIQYAIGLIVNSNGRITIKAIRASLHITERTFERQFIAHVGVSPKQFAKIIQFQTSLTQLTDQEYHKLTDIVFENGFVDQSHFIKSFKQFTGKTPTQFQKNK